MVEVDKDKYPVENSKAANHFNLKSIDKTFRNRMEKNPWAVLSLSFLGGTVLAYRFWRTRQS